VLHHLFVTEFGYEKKVAFADVMIERILETIDAFLQPIPLLKPGQLLWMAVRHDDRKHTFRSMKETPQVPVILDVVSDKDLQDLSDGQPFPAIRQHRHARLLDQAMAQGGVLAQTDLSAITLTSLAQVGSDIAHVQRAEERMLPYRGTVHDIGPTLSHKVEVARLLEAGFLETEIGAKLSPVHNLRSVERYAQTYKNVLKLLEHGLAPREIAAILKLSNRLMDAYIDMVGEHHPQTIAANPHLQPMEASTGSAPT
jgi:hypothetical protein